MSTWQRFAVAFSSTVSLMIGGVLYRRVFVNNLLPRVDPNGQFSQPVVWLDNLVPIILVMLLLAVWAWVIVGAVQDERTVDRRLMRR